MRRLRRVYAFFQPLQLLISLFVLMSICAGTAGAALLDFGPIVPEVVGSTQPNIGHGFPSWFRDTNRVPLQLCLEEVPGCLFAQADAPNPGQPVRFPDNLPDELFYYSATALIPNAIDDQLLFAGVEMNFADNGDGTYEQVGFARVRIRISTTVAGNYTVTTPWKQYFFTVTAAAIADTGGRRVINATEDIGLRADGDFAGVLEGNIGPYVYSQGAPFVTATGSFLGDNTDRPVVGSTFTDPVTGQPANIFRIQGPAGFPTVSTNLFAITGKLFLDPIATPLAVDKATYAQNGSGVQVSGFATTEALSNRTNPAAPFPANFALVGTPSALQLTGSGIPTQNMTTNNAADGKFFSTSGLLPAPVSIPATVTVTNTIDLPPTVKTVPLVDEVIIDKAVYNPATGTLALSATSSDKVAAPALQAFMPGMTAPLGTLANGLLNVTFPVTDNSVNPAKTYAIPPISVQVVSAIGGTDTETVSVILPPLPPVAVADSAVTAKSTPVTVNVLANDTAEGGLDPATVAIVATPASGSTAVANANGTITYNPTAAFTGTETFSYTVKDSFGQISNEAAVTVTVHAPPVAGNDTASAVIGTTVNIDVIANDTATSSSIDPATVNIVSAASCGSATVLANGSVDFTAPVVIPPAPGTCTFSYVVSDTFAPVAISNVATVTVTITPAPAPVANDDTAAANVGATIAISVLANDTAGSSPINPASVVVTQPAAGGGSAAANADGTVNYTAPGLTGTYSFTYTVKNSAAAPSTSNVATVTVTVTAAVPIAPTANNDTANATTGATISIPVLSNDTAGTSAINPATVVVTAPTGGTAIANANGTVSYTAPAGAGSYSFTYTVNDSATPAAISNSATVTVTVSAVVPPTANNDTAAAAAGATVPISVLTNDTAGTNAINPATVVVTAPTGGTAIANANGTVSYTAPAAAGSYTFTYTVKDNGVAPATSNSATVTVTVFVPPVAVNDSATTASGTAAVISVLANDTAGSSAINAASVVIATPPASGTAVANANGTVTFTPAAGFSGTRTFTYNVKDINGRVSNNATVTVTVTPPSETLTVTRAEVNANGTSWRIEGTTTARIARETIRIYNGPTIAAPLLGTVTVDPNGAWRFNLTTGPVPSSPARISLQSSLTPPAVLENVTVTVK